MTRVPRSERPITNPERYKWNALSNTTLGSFMALLNQSIVIISLPAIFRGIHLQPLAPANFGYLLWLLLGYLVVSAVLVVAFGRIGDQFGRVKMYNAGFLVFTVGSICLAFSPVSGPGGALVLIVLRLVQGVGGAMLMANSAAILTDAFPVAQRGTALGFNIIAGTFASFLGLVVGGALAGIDWRLVFLVSVPFGLFGTVWAYATLRETGTRAPARLDILGNVTFAAGLVLLMIGLTYGLQPYGTHTMGWASPVVLGELIGGVVLLVAFVWIENRVPEPMFHLSLFRLRAFAGAGSANLLANMGRGGLQFMLILWLQGIWLPLHGYSFDRTPLWSGIYMIPMSMGFLVAGPLSGRLSDRYGQRAFSTAGMVVASSSFILLLTLPINFTYIWFALLTFANGIGVGLFAAPNTTTIMNGVPPDQRGVASGMRATFMNSGFVLSIGIFFSLMVLGLASRLPATLSKGLVAQGVSPSVAHHVAGLPPVGTLFAAFLGYNPMSTLLGQHTLNSVGPAHAAVLTGKTFFPSLISGPFHFGLVIAFSASAALCAAAAVASWWAGNSVTETVMTPVVETGTDEPDQDLGEAGIMKAGMVKTGMSKTVGTEKSAVAIADDGLLRIGEAAERAGVSCRTLRYYEELGLLVPAGHSAGGARRYTGDDVERLRRIRELQELLGFDLGEIRTILLGEDQLADLRSEYNSGATIDRRREILAEATTINERLRETVRGKQGRLEEMMRELEARAKRYKVAVKNLESESPK